ncbi:cytochrome c [Microvirga sp. VF16]|uniref:c-type cytochrome n=1 Tax=Microvirga sp. VF16 TaxID=2807101 RepID=UPI00193EB4CD|nr:cytochrome c [Microvirga sp. VF16]QRM34707.1 cytochrome c [Microvirga sp. VF16]
MKFWSWKARAFGIFGLAALASLVWLGLTWFKTQTQVARGRDVYAIHCAACHGAKLEGEPEWQTPKPNGRMPAPPHDARGHTWHHTDRELFLITKKGLSAVVPGYESDMPAFENVLSDADIEAVLAFIRSTWPAEARRYQDDRNRAEVRRSVKDDPRDR